jgi:hypothetical protein
MTDRWRVGLLLPIAAILGCASGSSQLYDGPAQPREAVASIGRTPGTKVFAIDRARTSGDSWSVLPGPHAVWVDFQVTRFGGDVTYTVWAYCRIDFEAVAGGAYVVDTFDTQEQMKGADMKTKLGARIADATGSLVGVAANCSGKRPKLR